MAGNWTGSGVRHRGCGEERVLTFLLRGHYAERVEGECCRKRCVSLSDGEDCPQVPADRAEHPNGVTEIAYITVLIAQKDLNEFEQQLTSVVGSMPEIGPDDERTWSLSTTVCGSPHLILRTPRDKEEKEYLRERKGCIYKVAFQLTLEGGLLSI